MEREAEMDESERVRHEMGSQWGGGGEGQDPRGWGKHVRGPPRMTWGGDCAQQDSGHYALRGASA